MAIRVRAALMVPLAVETAALYSPGVGRRPNRAADFAVRLLFQQLPALCNLRVK